MDTYEFYVKVPVYVPFRCDAPDIGTARDFEKRIKKYWPAFLRDRCKVTVPGIRKVHVPDTGRQDHCSGFRFPQSDPSQIPCFPSGNDAEKSSIF